MFNKSMNSIRRLNNENFYFSNQSFQTWFLISCINVMMKYISALLIIPARPKQNSWTWVVNKTMLVLVVFNKTFATINFIN